MTYAMKLILTIVVLAFIALISIIFNRDGNSKIPIFFLAIATIAFLSIWNTKTIKVKSTERKEKLFKIDRSALKNLNYQNIIAWSMSIFLFGLIIWALTKIFKGDY